MLECTWKTKVFRLVGSIWRILLFHFIIMVLAIILESKLLLLFVLILVGSNTDKRLVHGDCSHWVLGQWLGIGVLFVFWGVFWRLFLLNVGLFLFDVVLFLFDVGLFLFDIGFSFFVCLSGSCITVLGAHVEGDILGGEWTVEWVGHDVIWWIDDADTFSRLLRSIRLDQIYKQLLWESSLFWYKILRNVAILVMIVVNYWIVIYIIRLDHYIFF